MVTYTVEGSTKTFSTWTDAKNHAATVIARRKTDSKVSIKRNGEPYGEMWRQNGKIKYTTPCKPHTMAIPDSKPKQTAKKTVKKTAKPVPKVPAKKSVPKKSTEMPVKATTKTKAVSPTVPKAKKPAKATGTAKKSKPKAAAAPKAVKAREIPALPEPREIAREPARERRYEPAPELLGPGAQRRERSERRSSAPALSFPTLSWDDGKARHEENRARRENAREERKQAREDRRFERQQRRAEREMRRHIYVDDPDDPGYGDGAKMRVNPRDDRHRTGESREIVRTRNPYKIYDAPEEIEAPRQRGIVPVRTGPKALPAPKSDSATATSEDGTTYEVEVIQPERRRSPCPSAAIARRRWGWCPHRSPISAGCSWRPWTEPPSPRSPSTRANARRYSRARSCAIAAYMDGGSPTARSAPSSRTDRWSRATDRGIPIRKPLPKPLPIPVPGTQPT